MNRRDVKLLIFLLLIFVGTPSALALPQDEETAETILVKLRSKDPAVQLQTLKVLIEKPRVPRSLVPQLRRILGKEGSWTLHTHAMKALGLSGSAAQSAMVELLAHFGDASRRQEAIAVVSKFDAETMPALRAALKNEGKQLARVGLALAMFRIDPSCARQVLPTIMKGLGASDARLYAVMALSELGADAAPASRELIKIARSKNPDETARTWAIHALSSIGEKAKGARPALMKLVLEEQDPSTLIQLIAGIRPFGPPPAKVTDRLFKLLKSDNESIRATTVDTIRQFKIKGSGKHLAPLLDDESASVRVEALRAFSDGLIPESKGERVSKLLEDPATHVRLWASWCFVWSESIPESSVPRLMKLLDDENASTVRYAARALGRFGPHARHAIARLVTQLLDPKRSVRADALLALQSIAKSREDFAPDLASMASKELEERLLSLGRLAAGDFPKDQTQLAIDAIVKATKDADPVARAVAAQLLGRHARSEDGTAMLLAPLLKDEDDRVRSEAIWAIERCRKKPDAVIDVVLEAMKDPELHPSGVLVLATSSRTDAPFVEVVKSCLGSPQLLVRIESFRILQRLGSDAAGASRLIAPFLNSEQETERLAALRAYEKTTPRSKVAVAAVRPMLEDLDMKVLATAIEVLPKLCPEDARARAELRAPIRKLRRHEHPLVKKVATAALKELK